MATDPRQQTLSLREITNRRRSITRQAHGGSLFSCPPEIHKPGFLMLKPEAGLPRARWLLAPTAPHIHHALILKTEEDRRDDETRRRDERRGSHRNQKKKRRMDLLSRV